MRTKVERSESVSSLSVHTAAPPDTAAQTAGPVRCFKKSEGEGRKGTEGKAKVRVLVRECVYLSTRQRL